MRDFGDSRAIAYCAFCGGNTETDDHCPSKVLLDEPYPEQLPVVPACKKCNAGFSLDEEYIACLISCMSSGTTNPPAQARIKISQILIEKPSLKQKIESSRTVDNDSFVFLPEQERVASVVKKLAQGHILYELHELFIHHPSSLFFHPIHLLNQTERTSFEHPVVPSVWPEVGSRMMQRLITGTGLDPAGWIVVQPTRYRYHLTYCAGICVRIVIQDYLACQISWNN